VATNAQNAIPASSLLRPVSLRSSDAGETVIGDEASRRGHWQASVRQVIESLRKAQQERCFRAAEISKRLAATGFRFFRRRKNISVVHDVKFTRPS